MVECVVILREKLNLNPLTGIDKYLSLINLHAEISSVLKSFANVCQALFKRKRLASRGK